jgi:hypothetical protein
MQISAVDRLCCYMLLYDMPSVCDTYLNCIVTQKKRRAKEILGRSVVVPTVS